MKQPILHIPKFAHAAGCLAGAILLSGCLTTTGSAPAKEVVIAPTEAVSPEEELLLTRIAEPSLPKGECGMVLWTATGERASPVFRYVSEKRAEVSLNSRQLILTRSNFTGTSGFGVFEQQEFVSDDGVKVGITVTFGLGFDGGTYLERGLITVETPEGWKTVVPAAGLAGCR